MLDKFAFKIVNNFFYSLEKYFGINLVNQSFTVLWKKCNINLPENQVHTFHLFDSQERHNKKFLLAKNLANGLSVSIPILLAFNLLLFCFFFVNYLWRNDLLVEIFGIIKYTPQILVWNYQNFIYYLIVIVWLIILWFDSVKFEDMRGYHNIKVNNDYRIGFILFLGSEIMFFFSVFWAFFHFSVGSNLDLGYMWPPIGINTVSYLNLPFFNTFLLITSGMFVTWSHNGIKRGLFNNAYAGLLCTIIFGILFLICQISEYLISSFNINDSVFGSIFFFWNWISWYACFSWNFGANL